jgi:hypothetical protein
VARRCASLLRGDPPDEADLQLLGYLAATPSLTAPQHGTWPSWYPVWAARGLRYAWRPAAAPAVVRALGDDAWRVREMAAAVCREREIGEAADVLAGLLADPVPRVRTAAARAVAVVGEVEHAAPLRRLLADTDPQVRAGAARALRDLARRLDRRLDLDLDLDLNADADVDRDTTP